MTKLLTKLHARGDRTDRGAASVEYGLMTTLVAVTIVAAMTLLGEDLAGLL